MPFIVSRTSHNATAPELSGYMREFSADDIFLIAGYSQVSRVVPAILRYQITTSPADMIAGIKRSIGTRSP